VSFSLLLSLSLSLSWAELTCGAVLREFAEGAVAGGFSNKGEPPFQIRGFSLGALVLALGVTITVTSFYSYFTNGNSITVRRPRALR
jgi:hypothetical protein